MTSTAATTARSCSSGARSPTRSSRPSSPPCSRPGYPLTDDVNGYRQEGFAAFDRNLHRGRRVSAADAYLRPVADRPNLDVRCRALVTRLVVDGTRVTGVEYVRGRRRERISCGEVILCGGAFNSPQLLQVSGIGDADHLRAVGVEPRHHLPGVGEHLQDHLEVYVQHACTQPVSLNPLMKWYRRPWIGLQWLARRGPGASNHFEGGGFIRSNDDVAYPNLMLHFLPIAVRYDGSAPAGGHGYQVHVGPMYSDSRGSVRITSPDVRVKPALRFNYLSTDAGPPGVGRGDRASVRDILAQPAFAPFDGGELSPGPAVQTDEEVLDWVARDAETALHPVVHVPHGHRRHRRGRSRRRCVSTAWTACAWSMRRRCRTSPTATSTPR